MKNFSGKNDWKASARQILHDFKYRAVRSYHVYKSDTNGVAHTDITEFFGPKTSMVDMVNYKTRIAWGKMQDGDLAKMAEENKKEGRGPVVIFARNEKKVGRREIKEQPGYAALTQEQVDKMWEAYDAFEVSSCGLRLSPRGGIKALFRRVTSSPTR